LVRWFLLLPWRHWLPHSLVLAGLSDAPLVAPGGRTWSSWTHLFLFEFCCLQMLKLRLYVMCLHANQTMIWLTITIDQSNGKLSLLNSVCRQQWEVGISHLLSLTSYRLLLADVDNHPHLFDR
jgi:hypothetical protein